MPVDPIAESSEMVVQLYIFEEYIIRTRNMWDSQIMGFHDDGAYFSKIKE